MVCIRLFTQGVVCVHARGLLHISYHVFSASLTDHDQVDVQSWPAAACFLHVLPIVIQPIKAVEHALTHFAYTATPVEIKMMCVKLPQTCIRHACHQSSLRQHALVCSIPRKAAFFAVMWTPLTPLLHKGIL